MPASPKRRVPKYRRQKSKTGPDRAFVEIDSRRHYLGEYGSPDSRVKYAELVGKPRPQSFERITVNDVLVAFFDYAGEYYRDRTGELSVEYTHYRLAGGWLRRAAGSTAAADFGPKRLKSIRASMIKAGWTRKYINGQMQRIRNIFRHTVSEELIPTSVHDALNTVTGLRAGKSAAKESTRRQPVPIEDVAPGTLLTIAEPDAADWNHDGQVNSLDLSTRNASHGMASAAHTDGDRDRDGDVDGGDFLNWQRQYFAEPVTPTVAVPEPVGRNMIAAGLGFLLLTTNRRSLA